MRWSVQMFCHGLVAMAYGATIRRSAPISLARGTAAAPRRRRMSAQRKQRSVLRLLRGEDLELVSRELGMTAADLSGWRDDFLAGGAVSLKSRPEDNRDRELHAMKGRAAT